MMSKDTELLVGLSDGELEALAESLLAPSAQVRLDELLARNADQQLSTKDEAELNRLLERIDQLTVLKTRARYTRRHQQAGATRT
jgi:molybdenum cofactor biosynthesis enzyme MoaA